MKKKCPDTEVIGDYVEGNLSEEEMSRMQEHFSECEMCMDLMIVANDLMYHTDDLELGAVPKGVTEAARRKVSQQKKARVEQFAEAVEKTVTDLTEKVADFFQLVPWGTAQLQVVRDAARPAKKDLVFLKKGFGSFDIRMEVEKIGAEECDIRIVFQGEKDITVGIRAILNRSGREMASSLIQDNEVLFESIPFGRYYLTFTKDRRELGSMDLEISNKGCGLR